MNARDQEKTNRVALILRAQGTTYKEIGDLLRVSEEDAEKAVHAAVKQANIEVPKELPLDWGKEFYFFTNNSEEPSLGHQNAADNCGWEQGLQGVRLFDAITEARKHKEQCR